MKKILIIQNKRIGDVLLASIISNNLKKMYPSSFISFLCYDYAAPVLYNNSSIDKIIPVQEKELKKLKNLIAISNNLRKEKFDIIIDPYVKFQSQVMSLLSGADQRISYKKKVLPFSYTHQVEILKNRVSPYGKAIDDRINLIRHLDTSFKFDVHPKLFLSEEEKAEGKRKLQPLDDSRKTVMFGALGSDPSKSLPLEYVVELLDFISEKYNFNILLNYMPSQKALISEIVGRVKSKENIYLDIVGKDIREFIKLMYHTDFLISNEGGSVHLAKALEKPTFTIYAPYIIKETWATFENDPKHKSLHLQEVRPDLFENKSRKEIKESTPELYKAFTPDLIIPSLKDFLNRN